MIYGLSRYYENFGYLALAQVYRDKNQGHPEKQRKVEPVEKAHEKGLEYKTGDFLDLNA